MRFCDSRTLYLSCLEAKDTAQSLWETLVIVFERIGVAIKSVVDAWDVLQSSVARQ